jgi:ribosomal protein L24
LIASKEIVLNGVIVSNKNLSAQEIVLKIKENLAQNHPQNLTTKRLFFRASETQYMSKMDVDFKKSSIGALNEKFIDSVMGLIPRNGAYFTEILADLHGDYTEKNQKIKLIKASKLYDKENEVSFEGIEKKFDEIFEQNVKKDSYLKVKSGWFSTKVSSDELFYKEAAIDSSNVALLDSLAAVKKEQELKRKESFASYRKNRMGRLFKRLFFNEDSPFDFLFKDNRYEIRLEDFTYLGALPVYQLRFTSKGRSDYDAVLYVNADDFGVVRLDFKNSQILKKVKLLGFSYVNYLSEGKAFFTKREDLGYQLSYLEETAAEKVGIKRPIKIIEKNKNTRGRRKQNELIVAIDFEINSRIRMKLSFLVTRLLIRKPLKPSKKTIRYYPHICLNTIQISGRDTILLNPIQP